MRFQHDCGHCVPLGEHGEADLYYCAQGDPTVIARYSSEGGDYSSGMSIPLPDLLEAKARAIKAGLYAEATLKTANS